LENQLKLFQQELALPGDDMHVDILYEARHDIYIYIYREREKERVREKEREKE